MSARIKTCPHCNGPLTLKPKEYFAIRVELGMTQREMAAALGVKASHVAYLENGRRNPSSTLLGKILKLKARGEKKKIADARRVLAKAA